MERGRQRGIENSVGVHAAAGTALIVLGAVIEGLTFFNSELFPLIKDQVLFGLSGLICFASAYLFLDRAIKINKRQNKIKNLS